MNKQTKKMSDSLIETENQMMVAKGRVKGAGWEGGTGGQGNG